LLRTIFKTPLPEFSPDTGSSLAAIAPLEQLWLELELRLHEGEGDFGAVTWELKVPPSGCMPDGFG
jgi:hypothetical protein